MVWREIQEEMGSHCRWQVKANFSCSNPSKHLLLKWYASRCLLSEFTNTGDGSASGCIFYYKLRSGGDHIYGVFDHQLPAALRNLPLDRHLSIQNVKRLVCEADGYQPHLIAPERGCRHLIDALERFREESKRTTLPLVGMESSRLTVDFFHKLSQEVEKAGSPTASTIDRRSKGHFSRIGTNVSSYISMVSEMLKNTILEAVVHCQIKEAKQSLLDHLLCVTGQERGFVSPYIASSNRDGVFSSMHHYSRSGILLSWYQFEVVCGRGNEARRGFEAICFFVAFLSFLEAPLDSTLGVGIGEQLIVGKTLCESIAL
ncbi:hypothetical protein Ancab_015659 [Ancistrocladus abbreviatus]